MNYTKVLCPACNEISDDQHWRCDNPQNDTIPFTDAPRTRSGRTRRARDLHAVLRTCVCGEEIDGDQIDEGIITCKQEGCETGLVSGF